MEKDYKYAIFTPHLYGGVFLFKGATVMNKKMDLKKVSVTAMLCAVAYLCMLLFKFKISFLTFDFKDALLAVIAFLYGPLYAVLSSVIVAFLELLSVSDTGIYGFIMNALSSSAFAGICGLVYKYRRTLSGAIIGAVLAVVSMTAVMLIANWVITPFYMGVPRSDVAALIPTLFLPFNLIKGVVNMAITLLIYKPITTALKKSGLVISGGKDTSLKRFLILSLIAVIIVVIAVLIIFFCFEGNFYFVNEN